MATHQQQVATLQQQVATLQQRVATPNSQQEDTPHRQEDTHNSLGATHLNLGHIHPKLVLTHQEQGATLLLRLVVSLPNQEASLSQEDTNHNLQQEVNPPCLQQVEDGVQHQAAMERQVELSRDTQGVLPQDSPCQITHNPPRPTPQCLDMGVELRPTLKYLQFLEGTGDLLMTFQGLIH